MAERIVVGFLLHLGSVDPAAQAAYVACATALCDEAAARGVRLCACEARGLAFDLAVERMQEAIEFAIWASQRAAGASVGGDTLSWNVGIAQGEMHVIMETGRLAVFGWGPPLAVAMALARMARRGEVLVDPRLPCVAGGDLLVGDLRHGHDGNHKIRGAVLDLRRVWRRDAVPVAEPARPAASDRAALGGFLDALVTGPVGHVLRSLEQDVHAKAAAPAAERSRALLAHAVGLAFAGRRTEALYQALTALARAREGNEPKGQRACARFLARLSVAAGEPEAAITWQKVEASLPRSP
jgi:hypothetical protein